MANPVRIYVLHHPASKKARTLTDRIYQWFRLPSLEGIPVYVRSAPAAEGRTPDLPYRAYARSKKEKSCLEYIVPLVDAQMVRDPEWHHYLADLAEQCTVDEKKEPLWGWRMFPVAMDSTAFNMPNGVSRMNFIRHGYGVARVAGEPAADEKEQQRRERERETAEAEETLKHLTEAFARDLNGRIFPEQKAERFEVFISYARADSTVEAKALRNYIQSQTQCLVFFDENDIGYGSAFDRIITSRVGGYSKALIVLDSDHYADRPWCRWEIDCFTEPRQPLRKVRGVRGSADIDVFLPLLVVDNMQGPKMTRMVPELAQAPVVRWGPEREKLCFSVLMREVVLGLRDVLEAKTIRWGNLTDAVIVNRLPGPVPLAKLVRASRLMKLGRTIKVHHPGHGLPFTELRLLERTFPHLEFCAFRDLLRGLPKAMKDALAEVEKGQEKDAPLRHKVIAVSTAHNEDDLAAIGYLPQHQDEALIHLLRPLVRLGADLMYGGFPPKQAMEVESASGAYKRNITLTLLHLLSSERRGEDIDRTRRASAKPVAGPMLFNVSSWPRCTEVNPEDEAAWVNACHVHKVMPEDADLPVWPGPAPKDKARPSLEQRRYLAKTFSHSRVILAKGFKCKVPGMLTRVVRPAAFVFIGGAMSGFKGVMPGVMEEFLRAATTTRTIPIYLMGGLGGATRAIANALLADAKAPCPGELTQDCFTDQKSRHRAEYQALLDELSDDEKAEVEKQFAELWEVIRSRRGGQGKLDNLFGNQLTDAENRTLLETTSTIEAVCLIWTGMSRVFLAKRKPARSPKAGTQKKAAPTTRTRGK